MTPTARSARCDEVMTLIFEAKKTQGTSELISNKTPETHLWLKNRLSGKAYLEISHHVYGLSTQEFCWKLAIGNKTTTVDFMVYQLWSCKQSLSYCYYHVFSVIQLGINFLAPNIRLPFPNLPWNHGLTCGLLAVFWPSLGHSWREFPAFSSHARWVFTKN